MTIDLEKFKINYMQPVSFEGAKEIGKPKGMTDEQCMSIWASSGVTAEGFPFFLEAWKPNYDDLQALNSGEPIYIQILSNGLPPISVFTIDFQQQSLNTPIDLDNPTKEMKLYALQEMVRLVEHLQHQPIECYSEKIKGQDKRFFLGYSYCQDLITTLKKQYK